MSRLWPRGQIDISWPDLAVALECCLRGPASSSRVWPTSKKHAVFFSVRSALDAYLACVAWEPGSEILVSEANIPGVFEIIRAHDLVPVPIPVSPRTLSPDENALPKLISPRTKAILVAHLFGSRANLDGIAQFARPHQLVLLEDCAQAYEGLRFKGHVEAHLTFFSFGIIKTQTALGGAIVFAKHPETLQRMNQISGRWPRQSREDFLKRVCRVGLLRFGSNPWLFRQFWELTRHLGLNPDDLLARSTRGVTGSNLFSSIRRRPSHPLVHFLRYRLRQPVASKIAYRQAQASKMTSRLPNQKLLGQAAPVHTHWVFPFLCDNREDLIRQLQANGFDASFKASSIVSEIEESPLNQALRQAIFLPNYDSMPDREVARLCEICHLAEPCPP